MSDSIKKKRSRGNPVPLIPEEYPDTYKGYKFITLIQYHRTQYITIVDNSDKKTISAFVLDRCAALNIDENVIVQLASEWYEHNLYKYPLSFEFSKNNIAHLTSRLYQTFNIEYVTRLIGPKPQYDIVGAAQVRRRKRKPLDLVD
jgi:hypothetical protein